MLGLEVIKAFPFDHVALPFVINPLMWNLQTHVVVRLEMTSEFY